MWTHVLQYQADSWDRPRRVILVVKERPDDLLLDRFFLVTSLTWRQMAKSEVLTHYRERGKAEDHMGELKDVLAPALSSPNRPKSHGADESHGAPRTPSMPLHATRCAFSSRSWPTK